MPPRYSYWTILAGGLPTAFRAAERADLLPTFNRIREKHADAEMKWFARGRLWASPEDAQADLQRARVRRDRDWRPGGEHRDPRQTFKRKRTRDTARGEERPRRPPSKPLASSTRPERPPSKPSGPAMHPKPSRPAMHHARPRSKPAGPSTRPAGPAGWSARPSRSASNKRPGQPPRKRQR
jgi:hypothetical protein